MLVTMKSEVNYAVEFIADLVRMHKKISEKDLQKFIQSLRIYLLQKYKNHWHPNKPWKGQGYRCLRLNGNNGKEATIDQAASASGLNYADLHLPLELTLWVDPNEVSCRFGERTGTTCTVATFKEGTPTFISKSHGKPFKSNETDYSSSVYTNKQVILNENRETSVSKKEEKKTALPNNRNGMSKSQEEYLTQDSKCDKNFTKNVSSFPQLKEASVESIEVFPPFQEKNISSVFSKSSSLIGYSSSSSVSSPLHSSYISNTSINNYSPTSHFLSRENLNFPRMSPVNVYKFRWNSARYPVYANQRNTWYMNRRVATV